MKIVIVLAEKTVPIIVQCPVHINLMSESCGFIGDIGVREGEQKELFNSDSKETRNNSIWGGKGLSKE